MVPALMLALLVVPIVEIAVIVKVGSLIGVAPTVVLLLVESALGAWIVKREGGRAWGALREAIATSRMPSRELADGALVLVGGTLLLTPGFVTDVAGFFLVLPFTRPVARRALFAVLARRIPAVRVTRAATTWWRAGQEPGGPGGGPGGPGGPGAGPASRPGDRVVPGEVVDRDL